jgi:hypothetical protein
VHTPNPLRLALFKGGTIASMAYRVNEKPENNLPGKLKILAKFHPPAPRIFFNRRETA